MSNGFIKYNRSDSAKNLESRPNENHLLSVIARRVSRNGNPVKGVEIGEALIGDFENLGLKRQPYRTAIANLKKWGYITTRATNKTTYARLCNTDIYDCNIFSTNQQTNQPLTNKPTSEQPPEQPTANHYQELKKKEVKKEESFDKRKNKNLPFDVVTSSQTIKAIFEDTTEAIRSVKEIFQIDATDKDVKTAIHTFSTVAIASYDAYRGIRTIEKLRNKFISWIPKSIKFQASKGESANCDNSLPLNLSSYLAPFYHKVEHRRMVESGKMQEMQKLLEKESFRLGNIAKSYKNKSITTLFLFEALFLPLGNRLGGSNDTRKLESLQRWEKTLSDYNQGQGDFRKLLKERNKNQSL
jgi:hypothetical protein